MLVLVPIRRPVALARKWFGASTYFVGRGSDPDNPIQVPPPNPLCTECLSSRQGRAACNASVEAVLFGDKGEEFQVPRTGRCHLGLGMASAAVRGGGALVACGLLPEPGGEQEVLEAASDLGLSDHASKALASRAVRGPQDAARLLDLVSDAAEALSEAVESLPPNPAPPVPKDSFGPLVSWSEKAGRALESLRLASGNREPLVIGGDPGTGKSTAARAVHDVRSPGRPFVPIHSGAVDASDVPGLIRSAADGTALFEDADLLNTAASREVGAAVLAGGPAVVLTIRGRVHRQSLPPAALGGSTVRLPSLSECKGGASALLAHYLREAGIDAPLDGAFAAEIDRAPWAGNCAELRVFARRLAAASVGLGSVGTRERRAAGLFGPADADRQAPFRAPAPATGLKGLREKMEIEQIRDALLRHEGNKSAAAAEIGISRTTLIKKIKEYML